MSSARRESEGQAVDWVGDTADIDGGAGASATAAQAAGSAAVSRVAADDGSAGDNARALQERVVDLQQLVAELGDQRLRAMTDLLLTAQVEGVSSPATLSKLMTLVDLEKESIATRFIPGLSPLKVIKEAATGQDKAGRDLSAGERVLRAFKGVVGLLMDLHTLGGSSQLMRALSTASRAKSAADRMESAMRIAPALSALLANPNDMALFAQFVAVARHPSFGTTLVRGLETQLISAIDRPPGEGASPAVSGDSTGSAAATPRVPE